VPADRLDHLLARLREESTPAASVLGTCTAEPGVIRVDG